MEWVKALHVIAVIAWMAGLLYLPRLFVYHADAETGSVQSETFKVMERRLLRAITTPAMIAAWVFGLWMVFVYGPSIFAGGWAWLKGVLVILLSGYHGLLVRHWKAFAADRNDKPSRYFRMINEIPTVLMIGIVIAVIVKPF
jgi:putative membrane protein